jgi:hypothetical protein
VFETAYRSPQLALWSLDDDQWRKVLPVAAARHRVRPPAEPAMQAALFT